MKIDDQEYIKKKLDFIYELISYRKETAREQLAALKDLDINGPVILLMKCIENRRKNKKDCVNNNEYMESFLFAGTKTEKEDPVKADIENIQFRKETDSSENLEENILEFSDSTNKNDLLCDINISADEKIDRIENNKKTKRGRKRKIPENVKSTKKLTRSVPLQNKQSLSEDTESVACNKFNEIDETPALDLRKKRLEGLKNIKIDSSFYDFNEEMSTRLNDSLFSLDDIEYE